MRGRTVGVVLVAGTLVLSACSSSSNSSSSNKLTVFAAASLTKVFPEIGAKFSQAHPGTTFKYSFGGTDTLAAQIQQGAPADVFAGASTKYGDELSSKGLIDTPQNFCTNTLVVVVPASNPAKIKSPKDLSQSGIKLVIGDASVPIGSYTREVLTNLDSIYGSGYSDKVLANVVSEEPDVTSIISKVEAGEADAGFVYITDALAAGSQVKAIMLPTAAQATAVYPIATVKSSKEATLAQQFVEFVLAPQAQSMLKEAGFGPPPSS